MGSSQNVRFPRESGPQIRFDRSPLLTLSGHSVEYAVPAGEYRKPGIPAPRHGVATQVFARHLNLENPAVARTHH